LSFLPCARKSCLNSKT